MPHDIDNDDDDVDGDDFDADVDDYDEWHPNGRHTNAGVRIMVVGMWVTT